MSEKKLNGTVIVTYRCNARCSMCNRYKAPSKPDEEISIETIKKLPKMYFTNITGGEPFIRTDLKDIVRELYKKSDRIVISTNGFFTDRIVDLAKEFPQIGIRISIEGLEKTNNEIRGLENGFQRGYGTLKKLREMGMKDVGFGMTVQDKNAPDLVPLYELSNEMGMEFATASLHNSFYFVEAKNIINDRPMVAKNFENLVNELLKSNSPKKWFRAYFNHGLINYIYGQKRLLPCDMSFDTFFIDPYGDVIQCLANAVKENMGIRWLPGLSEKLFFAKSEDVKDADFFVDCIEKIESVFTSMPTLQKIEKKIESILRDLNSPNGNEFERGHKGLGELLGFISENPNSTGAPDPYWIINENNLVVSEDKIYEEKDQVKKVPISDVSEAGRHKAWIIEHEKRITKDVNVYTILITNSDGIDDDARIYADDIYYVNRKEYVDWAVKALTVVRSVWSTFSGEGESEWRESVHKEFIKVGITPKDYLDFVCSKNLKDM